MSSSKSHTSATGRRIVVATRAPSSQRWPLSCWSMLTLRVSTTLACPARLVTGRSPRRPALPSECADRRISEACSEAEDLAADWAASRRREGAVGLQRGTGAFVHHRRIGHSSQKKFREPGSRPVGSRSRWPSPWSTSPRRRPLSGLPCWPDTASSSRSRTATPCCHRSIVRPARWLAPTEATPGDDTWRGAGPRARPCETAMEAAEVL